MTKSEQPFARGKGKPEGGQSPSAATPLAMARLHGNELIATPIGPVELVHSYFDDAAAARLYDEMDYQRACQAYVWSTPIVSFMAFREAQTASFGVAGETDFVVHNSLREKRGIVTANLTTPYILNFISLAEGPLEIHYPAGQTAGGIMDAWQRPVCDLGLTGPDKGQGGTYIIVGPQHEVEQYRRDGVHVFQSATNKLMVGLRIIDQTPGFFEKVTEQLVWGRVGQPLQRSRYIVGKDVEWDATAPRGLDYWQLLASALQDEPVRPIDKAWTAMLLPLGIAKGKSFAPDARQRRILPEGAAMGELMTRNLSVNPRFADPYWPNSGWYKCFDFHIPQEVEDRAEIDERACWYYEAVTSSEGMVNPVVGAGQVYMTTKRDRSGQMLRADRAYRLHVPKDVPAAQFWSLTLYSENTRRPYDNGGTEIASTSLDSRTPGLQRNADGSIDLYVGAKAPAGMESNFMQTVGEDGWFVYFRLYAPLEPFFDKSWQLGDFEEITL